MDALLRALLIGWAVLALGGASLAQANDGPAPNSAMLTTSDGYGPAGDTSASAAATTTNRRAGSASGEGQQLRQRLRDGSCVAAADGGRGQRARAGGESERPGQMARRLGRGNRSLSANSSWGA